MLFLLKAFASNLDNSNIPTAYLTVPLFSTRSTVSVFDNNSTNLRWDIDLNPYSSNFNNQPYYTNNYDYNVYNAVEQPNTSIFYGGISSVQNEHYLQNTNQLYNYMNNPLFQNSNSIIPSDGSFIQRYSQQSNQGINPLVGTSSNFAQNDSFNGYYPHNSVDNYDLSANNFVPPSLKHFNSPNGNFYKNNKITQRFQKNKNYDNVRAPNVRHKNNFYTYKSRIFKNSTEIPNTNNTKHDTSFLLEPKKTENKDNKVIEAESQQSGSQEISEKITENLNEKKTEMQKIDNSNKSVINNENNSDSSKSNKQTDVNITDCESIKDKTKVCSTKFIAESSTKNLLENDIIVYNSDLTEECRNVLFSNNKLNKPNQTLEINSDDKDWTKNKTNDTAIEKLSEEVALNKQKSEVVTKDKVQMKINSDEKSKSRKNKKAAKSNNSIANDLTKDTLQNTNDSIRLSQSDENIKGSEDKQVTTKDSVSEIKIDRENQNIIINPKKHKNNQKRRKKLLKKKQKKNEEKEFEKLLDEFKKLDLAEAEKKATLSEKKPEPDTQNQPTKQVYLNELVKLSLIIQFRQLCIENNYCTINTLANVRSKYLDIKTCEKFANSLQEHFSKYVFTTKPNTINYKEITKLSLYYLMLNKESINQGQALLLSTLTIFVSVVLDRNIIEPFNFCTLFLDVYINLAQKKTKKFSFFVCFITFFIKQNFEVSEDDLIYDIWDNPGIQKININSIYKAWEYYDNHFFNESNDLLNYALVKNQLFKNLSKNEILDKEEILDDLESYVLKFKRFTEEVVNFIYPSNYDKDLTHLK